MTNTRIRSIADGVQAERIATETHMFYDPLTQDAQVVFQGQEFLDVAGVLTQPLDGREALQTSLAALAARKFAAGVDPITGADLSDISGAGVTMILKAIYDTLHNEVHAPEPAASEAE